MSESNVRVEELLKRMGTAAVPADDAAHEREQRDRSVAAMNERLDALAKEKRRSRRASRAWLLAAAAALVVGVAGVVLFGTTRAPTASVGPGTTMVVALEGNVEVVHGARRLPAAKAEPSVFAAGDELHTTAGGRARAELPSGARVNVEERSMLRFSRISSDQEELGLTQGRVEVSVPPLGAGETLSVRTPDARVTVRGTRFVVEVTARETGSVTAVAVLEGSVWVEARGRKLVLEAGSRFTSDGEPERRTEPPGAPLLSAAPSTPNAREVPAESASGARRDVRDEATSTLAIENELYLDAMRAARAGDEAGAAAKLGVLLERYPRSPLAPNARAELERIRSRNKAPR